MRSTPSPRRRDAVPGHLFDATHAALIADDAVLAAMLDKNPAATAAIVGPAARRARTAACGSRGRNSVALELDRAIKKARS